MKLTISYDSRARVSLISMTLNENYSREYLLQENEVKDRVKSPNVVPFFQDPIKFTLIIEKFSVGYSVIWKIALKILMTLSEIYNKREVCQIRNIPIFHILWKKIEEWSSD